jgi:uncharacterized protein YjbI with pentapeptide repeats
MNIQTSTSHPLALGSLLWRHPSGQWQVTAIAKATFELKPDVSTPLTAPMPLVKDVYSDGNEGGSLYAASDFVPLKPRADVVFLGCAYAPPGQEVSQVFIRLAFSDAHRLVIDKRIAVVGGRRRAPGGAPPMPIPFRRMLLRYELALGGAGSSVNPVGVGAELGDTRAPNLLDPLRPAQVAGFGPVPGHWSWRSERLRPGDAQTVECELPALPAGLDSSYYNSAPPDQQVPFLRGDKYLLLGGLHPTLAEVRCHLPAWHAYAFLETGGVASNRVAIALVADTLWIDGERMLACLTWRGHIGVTDEIAAGRIPLRLVAALAPDQHPAPQPVTIAPPPVIPALPPIAPAVALAQSALGDPSMQGPLPEAPLPPSSVSGEWPLDGPPTEAPPPPSTAPSDWPLDGPPTTQAPPLPSVPIEGPLRAPRSEARPPSIEAPRFQAPPRTTEALPIVNTTPYPVVTLPWQINPPHGTLVVVLKGTFSLVPGANAITADAQEMPTGDVHYDDDPRASLRYPSDFAPFKPAADVMLVGFAYPPPGRNLALVNLRVGALTRKIVALGNRPGGSGAGEPQPFERMPLRYEHAFGGPLSDANPVGIGYKTKRASPNLELPDRLVRGFVGSPPPAGVGPIAPAWAPRASKAGTYDAAWRKARWPYFPADFDWKFFNAAPDEQQVDYLQGDEEYEITSVRPGGLALSGRLPGLRPRLFAQRSALAGEEFFEILLRLDTVYFDAETLKLNLLWRGSFDARDSEPWCTACLFVTADPAEAPLSLEDAQRRFHAEVMERGMLPAEPAASGSPSAAPELPPGRALAPVAAIAAVSRARVEAWLAAGESLAKRDLSGADLAGLDLRERDLTGAILKGATLTGAKLDGARCEGINAAGARAEGSTWVGADLSRADFQGAELRGADFSLAKLEETSFDGAAAESSIWKGASAAGAQFVGAKLAASVLDEATLTKADFSETALDAASFRRAKLDDARFYDARGERIVADGASLADARLEACCFPHGSFRAVAAQGSTWERADLTSATFQDADLRGAGFVRATLSEAIFTDADATEGRFRKATLERASLLKTNLMHATFEQANLIGADLRGANLYQAETWNAQIGGANFDLAFVAGSKLER